MDIACPKCAAAYELDEATVGPAGRKVRCAACGEVWRVMPPEPADTVFATQEVARQEVARQENAKQESAKAESAVDDGWDSAPPATTDPVSEEKARTIDGAASPEAASAGGEPPAATAEPEPEPQAAPRGARLVRDAGGSKKKPAAWRRIADWRVVTVAATAVVMAACLHQRDAVVRLLPQTAKIYAAVGLPVNLRGIEIRNVQSRLVTDNDEPVLVVDGDLVNVSTRKVDVPRLHFSLQGPDGRQVYVWSAQADRASLQPGETLNFRRRLAAPPAEAKNVSVRFLTRSDITAGIK